MTADLTVRRALRRLALTLCLGTAALASPAQAQFFGWSGWDGGGYGGMPGPQVRRVIQGQGFRVLGPLRRNGNVFVADVIDGRGRHERLIVASADAQILQRFYVDDGRGPGPFARGDDEGGLVPPADIPGVPRPRGDRPRPYALAPADRPAPGRRGVNSDGTEVPDTAVVEPPPVRGQPPVKTVRPTPRVVERTPEAPQRREPAAVDATPLAPAAPKPRAVEPAARAAPPKPTPAAVASRPDAASAPAAPATVPAPQPHRLTDPLAIPGGSAKSAEPAPPRSVSGSVTGAPPAAVKPAEGSAPKATDGVPPKAGEVQAAPLD